MTGTLTLIPTPISSDIALEPIARELLANGYANGSLILVEEHKVARRRWIKEELPREAIDDFVLYNEHSFQEAGEDALKALKSGTDVFLFSDCGLPAFCDPGRLLVESCHKKKIKVTSAPFANSIALALALSGFVHDKFIFEGFIPARRPERGQELKRILREKRTTILMDTPYRLLKFLEEISTAGFSREIFLGMNLNCPNEQLLRGNIKDIIKNIKEPKSEFILILGPHL